MVWSRASLVVGQQHGGLARRLWHSRWLLSRPPRWLKRLPSTDAACRATISPLHDHRIALAAPLCYMVALPRQSAVLHLPLLRGSVTAPLLPLIVAPLPNFWLFQPLPLGDFDFFLLSSAPCRLIQPQCGNTQAGYCRDAAPLRYFRACCRTASLCCGRVAQLLLSNTLQPLCYCGVAPLHCRVAPLRAAPRHSATCTAASLLPRCFAAAAPLRYCHSTARPPFGCA